MERLGNRDTERAGSGQISPHLAVEPRFRWRVRNALRRTRRPRLEDRGGALRYRSLRLAECEVHHDLLRRGLDEGMTTDHRSGRSSALPAIDVTASPSGV